MTWTTAKLCELCLIRPPKSEVKTKNLENSLVSFMGMEHLGVNEKYAYPSIEKKIEEVYSGYTYFAENDVLLAKITPCFENGKLGIAKNLKNGVGFGSTEFFVFRPNSELLSDWLYYYLSRNDFLKEGAKNMSGAVGHKRVNADFIKNYLIPLPPLAEQKRIAAILDKANEIKAKRELALAKLDDFEDSIFNKMFEQSSNAQASLKEICEFKYGKSLPSEKRISGNIKVYGSNGVVGSHETALTKGPTIIVGRKGSYGEINFSDVSCFPIDTTYYIDSTASKQNLVWLAKALSKLGLNKMNKSAAVPGLSREDAYRQLVKLPSLQKQIEFEEITKRINHERDKLRLFLSESIALNQSLQNQAFTTGFNA